ncbi:MAG: GHKL domain-containing protein [Lachnospiraceae bacterium]|nr:GHKL domain-containing protein [Lachnospiraceae bacterium]
MIVSWENPQEIYIAIANSYCGPLRQIENRYLSTHKGGSGIGLLSVAATAARYDGTATFTHDGTIFYSDVVVKTRSRVLRAGFGSASADKFLSESVRILAERLTQSELVPRLS